MTGFPERNPNMNNERMLGITQANFYAYLLITNKGVQEYIIVDTQPAPQIVSELSWSHYVTLLLINLYRQLRIKVGSLQIKNMKSLWEVVAEKTNATFGCN
nr:unnamed protein product [Callosobruchus analis]